MRQARHRNPCTRFPLLAAAAVIAACGDPAVPPKGPDAPPTVATAAVVPVPAAGADAPAVTPEALAAREAELARREQELQLREREAELARREAALAAREKAATARLPAPKPATAVAARPATGAPAARRPAAATPDRAATPSPATPVVPIVTRVTVPAGTQLAVALDTALSTKTARVGEPFEAQLSADVAVQGRTVLPAGTRVTGTITDVVSGSSRIGGVPTLGLRFDGLELRDGQRFAITGDVVEQGRSDTARDTAKILGGAAAGAILGHQVKRSDSGKVIGGLIGGAIGAVAAQKTGTEVELPAGTGLAIALAAPIEVVLR